MKQRKIYQNIWDTLSRHRQMVFITGPRQAGKTTFAKMISKKYSNSLYFNWDITEDKKKLFDNDYFYEEVSRKDSSQPLIILDEIHKYEHWKNYLKGAYDRDKDTVKFLVSGSGRLDLYQKGGDSLAGRYFLFHLWPFTLGELANQNRPFREFLKAPFDIEIKNETSVKNIWKRLSRFSGFPDPYISNDTAFFNIWSQTYHKQLVREDIRDLTGIKKIDHIELLFAVLPSKIGSPISMNNIARDLKVSFDSIKLWLQAFDNYFISFRIPPWSKKVARAIKKEKKLYLFDYTAIEQEGPKFENMVALELLRATTNWSERGLGKFELNYVRTKDGEEVDFLIVKDKKPLLLVECKLFDSGPSKGMKKIQRQLGVPAVQLINNDTVYKISSNDTFKILTITANQWLAKLP